MVLSEWIRQRGHGAIADIARRSGLNYSTVWPLCARGERPKTYSTAKAISVATDGAVSIAELFEPGIPVIERGAENASQ